VDQGTFRPLEKVENFIGSPGFNPNEAEEKITARFTTSKNIQIERVSRAWSFRGLNNFIIIEYTFTNQNASSLSNVFFGFPYLIRPSYQDFVVHNGWGDDFNRTDELVAYDSDRALLYAYDDTPNFSLPTDVGNYWEAADEMRTPGYAGYSLLHFDPASDGRIQPSTVFYAQLLNNEPRFTLTSTSEDDFYAILSGTDRSLQAQPDERLTPVMLMACGPYTLSSGSSVRIVLVEAVNGIPIDRALSGLSAQTLLPAGLDSLRNTVDRARVLFENNYQLTGVPPPSPDIEIIPIPATQSITISWEPIGETWVNPISGESDLSEYRIYRAERAFIGPFTRISRVRINSSVDRRRFFNTELGRWLIEDQSITVGTNYFYAVSSVDEAGRESWLTNRNENPVRAASEPAENTMDVTVFPNPFRGESGFPTVGEENSIVWTNLPEKCSIRIYTVNGELVKTMEHDDPFSGEEVWDQLSDSRQRTAPGAYFWTVESNVGQAKGTLLIIK
jgi:hypothetical protein